MSSRLSLDSPNSSKHARRSAACTAKSGPVTPSLCPRVNCASDPCAALLHRRALQNGTQSGGAAGPAAWAAPAGAPHAAEQADPISNEPSFLYATPLHLAAYFGHLLVSAVPIRLSSAEPTEYARGVVSASVVIGKVTCLRTDARASTAGRIHHHSCARTQYPRSRLGHDESCRRRVGRWWRSCCDPPAAIRWQGRRKG